MVQKGGEKPLVVNVVHFLDAVSSRLDSIPCCDYSGSASLLLEAEASLCDYNNMMAHNHVDGCMHSRCVYARPKKVMCRNVYTLLARLVCT